MTTAVYMPDDFCRTCGGKGGVTEPSAHRAGAWVFSSCYECNGTGWRPGAALNPETMEAIK